MNLLRPFCAAALTAGLILGTVAIVGGNWPPGAAVKLPPMPDLTGMEPPVRDALRRAWQAVAASPHSAAAWGEWAMSLHVHGLNAPADAAYATAARLAPHDYRWPYLRGLACRASDLDRGVNLLDAAAALAPRDAAVAVRCGQLLLTAGRVAEARRHFQRAAALDATCSHAWLGLAQVHVHDGEYPQARAALERALPHAGDHGAVHSLLSKVLLRLGDAPAAAQAAARAARLSPDGRLRDPAYDALLARGASAQWHNHRGNELSQAGRHVQAVEEYRQAAAIRGDVAAYRFNLAEELVRLDRLTEAAEQYAAGLNIDPRQARRWNRCGVVLCRLGRCEEGIAAFRKALALDARLPDAVSNLWRALLEAGDFPAALAALSSGVRENPDDAALVTTLAWVLATHPDRAVRDGPRAEQLSRHAADLTQDRNPRVLAAQAAAAAERGRFDEALRHVRRGLELARSAVPPDDAVVAMFQRLLRNYERGEPVYEAP